MTAQELAAEMHKFGLITFNRWAIDGAEMLLQQAEQIERLYKERDGLLTAISERDAVLRQQAEQLESLKADAERYRWLKDNRSYAYAMQPDSPAECGIEFQWQQCSYEERNWNIDSAIDDEISRAAIDAMKGTT